jgi:hypothetical protein
VYDIFHNRLLKHRVLHPMGFYFLRNTSDEHEGLFLYHHNTDKPNRHGLVFQAVFSAISDLLIYQRKSFVATFSSEVKRRGREVATQPTSERVGKPQLIFNRFIIFIS